MKIDNEETSAVHNQNCKRIKLTMQQDLMLSINTKGNNILTTKNVNLNSLRGNGVNDNYDNNDKNNKNSCYNRTTNTYIKSMPNGNI